MNKFKDENGMEWEAEIIDGTHIKLRVVGSEAGYNEGWGIALHFRQVRDETLERLKAIGLVRDNFFVDNSHPPEDQCTNCQEDCDYCYHSK